MTYLSLRPTARFVRGPRRAALYDLSARRIYPLDEWTGRLIGDSLEGRSVESVLEEQGVHGSRLRSMILEALSDHPLLLPAPTPSPFLSLRQEISQGATRQAAEPGCEPGSIPVSGLIGASGRLKMASPAASKAETRQRLDFLWLELTERCNLRCVHCYAGSGPALKDGPMQAEDHLRVLREAAQAGCRRVQFTGGEATLHPAFSALVDEAKALGFERIEVYTNATQLNDERVSFLREHGVRVAVSFYSHREEVHESITRVPGSFRRTVAAIKALLAAEVPVRVGLIRMRPNQDDVPATLDFLAALGVAPDAVGMDDVRPAGRGCGDSLVPSGG
ncbi:MAG: radical SAM protein, partial [Anaerolineales bacterium]